MGIHINFSDVPDNDFEPLDAGIYSCVIDKIEERESKSSEHNYFNWELTVAGGDHKGRKLWFMTSLSPKALWKLRDTLVNLGVDATELKTGTYEFDPETFLNTPVEAEVVQETYNDQLQNRVENLKKGTVDARL